MDTVSRRDPADLLATYRRDCPSRTVVEVLANKWSLYVLAALRRSDGPLRFGRLRRQLDGVTQKMLTQTLRSLERDGLVERTVYPTVPPRVEYSLTGLGHSVGRLTTAVADWAVDHAALIHSARAAFDARPEQPEPAR
ncbi:helix-turn-helix domain-containing protein [Kitasatospora sp. NPDC097691]|uniref:winged helix-turn-helix transcriptional regulator n=1 Tax=Kitasatospora sp. NPDC097691 TaxID=3157231 RepID=UPI00331BC6C4